MSDFHYRSAVASDANNRKLIIRRGVLLSWYSVLKNGDLFINKGQIVRCSGVSRSLTRADVVKFTSIDGTHSGSRYAHEGERVEKLDLIGYSDILRFLNGTQPQFIRDVNNLVERNQVLSRTVAAQRERDRRAMETPEQADERRRKNRENMRRRRAGR